MKKLLFSLCLFTVAQSFAQKQDKIAGYLSFQVDNTCYDRTITNNATGFGLAFQSFLNTNSLLNPTLEMNVAGYGGTKELYVTPDRKPIDAKETVLTIFAGPFLPINKNFFVAATAGAAMFNDKVYAGVRPSVGVYPFNSKALLLKAAFTNIFQRDQISRQNFGYLSFSIGIKLF